MKNFKDLIKYLSVFVFAIGILSSCSKDDKLVNSNNPSTTNNTGGNVGQGNGNNNQGGDGEITLYKVEENKINKIRDFAVTGADLSFQKDVAKHNEIWDLVKKIVPPNQLKKIGEFAIYNGSSSGSLGYVVQIKEDLTKWKMGIAINSAYKGGFNKGGELSYTIIHEFGHVLTLNDTQLVANQSSCNTYNPGEGCAKQNAYINELYQNYWADIWSTFQTASNSGEAALQKFYEDNRARFVTNYAATNPPEDIAEVFAIFVTRRDKPQGNTIAEKKILLMYKRSELVDFRNHIRRNLSLRRRGVGSNFILPEPGSWKQANKIGKSCRHHK